VASGDRYVERFIRLRWEGIGVDEDEDG